MEEKNKVEIRKIILVDKQNNIVKEPTINK
jgi:hypothetical protein